jgi:hypothetical protein
MSFNALTQLKLQIGGAWSGLEIGFFIRVAASDNVLHEHPEQRGLGKPAGRSSESQVGVGWANRRKV